MPESVTYPQLRDHDWLQREYVAKRRSAPQIAAEVGCTGETVYRALRRFDIPIRTKGPATRAWRGLSDFDDAGAVELYKAGMSAKALGRLLNASPHTIVKALRNNGVEIRTQREAALRRRDVSRRRLPRPSDARGVLDVCAACDRVDSLEIHHINADPADNRPENLITLCWEHHVLVEFLVTSALHGIRQRNLVLAPSLGARPSRAPQAEPSGSGPFGF